MVALEEELVCDVACDVAVCACEDDCGGWGEGRVGDVEGHFVWMLVIGLWWFLGEIKEGEKK